MCPSGSRPMRGWPWRVVAGPGRGAARRGPRSSAPSRPGQRAAWCAVGTSGFSFTGPGRARLVPGEVTAVAVPLPGDRHVVPEPAVCQRSQYPYPPPPEPDEEFAAGALPEVVTSCHNPPNAFRPLPLACPGAVSPTKVYSGCPSKVACVEPSERVIVPNVPVTPAAVTGPVTGGQFCAQVPLHFDVVDVSGANEYSVKPLLLVSTVTPPIFAVCTVPAAAAAGLLLLLEDEGAG